MKSQKHNIGELKEVSVKIESKVVEDLELMAKNTGMPVADIVVIALKRFRSSHLDYLKQVPMTEQVELIPRGHLKGAFVFYP